MRYLMFAILDLMLVVFIFSGCASSNGEAQLNAQISPDPEPLEPKYVITVFDDPSIRALSSPFEVSTDNCGNPNITIGNFSQTQEFNIEFELTLSQEISEQLGGELTVKDKLGTEIEKFVGVSFGDRKSVEEDWPISVPANSRTIVKLQWEEIWTLGTIKIEDINGKSVGDVPFSLLDSVRLIQLGEETETCIDPLSTSTVTFSPSPSPTATSTPSPSPKNTVPPSPSPTKTVPPLPSPSLSPLETPSSPSTLEPVTSSTNVSAPNVIEYNRVHFIWEWKGEDQVSNEDWYFDLKFYSNIFSEYPYDVVVIEPADAEQTGGKWYFGEGTINPRCGSFWSIQIAKRNSEGEYEGPLSPESDRIRTGVGCTSSSDDNSDSNSGGRRPYP